MIKKSVFEDELISNMEHILVLSKTAEDKSLEKAVDYLNSAIDIFEDSGMYAQADKILGILTKLADADWEDEIQGGKADKYNPDDFNTKTLEQGMKVEKEHTNDPHKAREIAMDHMVETRKSPNGKIESDYYKELSKLENKLEDNNSAKTHKDYYHPKSPDKMIKNLLDHGTMFNSMKDRNSVEDLLDADMPDDLSVSEEDISTSPTFEDED